MKVNITAKTIENVINGEIVNIYDLKRKKYFKQTNFKKNDLKVFISYSHEDQSIKEQLDIHLAALKRNKKIVVWSDKKILPGQEWDLEIREELASADLILLLISPFFIASDYIWKFELSKAIERHAAGNAIVIPIYCKPCDFSGMPFAKLQGLPHDAIPVSSAKDINQILTEVVTGIKIVVDNILEKSPE